jgi:hypothetical protein
VEPFASVEDYLRRYPDDDTDGAVILEVLTDATDVICAEMDDAGIDYEEPDETFAGRLRRVCRTMAHRALGCSDDSEVPFGAEQLSQSADTFSASVRLSNPYGDLFLTEQERRSLGIGSSGAFAFSPYGGWDDAS